MPLQATSGAASYDAFGGGVAAVPNYIEDVFSTYLYTGTSANQNIVNGIDLSTKGGMVWLKSRSNATNNYVYDTNRGLNRLVTNLTNGGFPLTDGLSAFNSNGFSLGDDATAGQVNVSGRTYASWTFRKQPKFFDVVTYTGTGATRTIAHNLGSVPGCIIIKSTNLTSDWVVYHRSLGNTDYAKLNLTDASAQVPNYWNNTSPTSTNFTVKTSQDVNGDGQEYEAYIFAHDAGGFGLTGTDNVISCGSYTGVTYPNSLEVNLGFEPQWVLIKNATTAAGWAMWDVMRGMSVVPAANTAQALLIEPNTTAADSNQPGIYPTPTGFVVKNGLTSISGTGDTITYIAIRRGPMKVPTSGTSVFKPFTRAGNDTQTDVTGVGFTPDLWMVKDRTLAADFPFFDRLRGVTKRVVSNSTNAEETFSGSNGLVSLNMDGITIGAGALDGGICNDTGSNYGNWLLKRAPNTFDEVCFKGTGSAQNISHNLGVAPEFMMVKERNGANSWYGYAASEGATKGRGWNSSNAFFTASSLWNDTTPTSSVFTVGTAAATNGSGQDFVAYLWATNAGVTKVGSYTGNGSSQTINCGFTGGSRFVLIKRTDDVGDWYVWDSARGIVSGNDPHLSLNSTAVEVTTDDTIDTDSTGFIVNQVSATNCNVNGASYIFLSYA